MTTHFGLFGGLPHDATPHELAQLDGFVAGFRKPPIEGAPELWGIGAAEMASGIEPLPTTYADSERDFGWAGKMLDEFGVARGDVAFFLFLYPQSVQIWPWCASCVNRKAPFATGMPTFWDAYRLEMYLRRFDLKLVFGVSAGTLQGLQAGGHDPGEVLGRAGAIVTSPDGFAGARDLGLQPWRMVPVGPILALDPGDGAGARFDASQWSLAARNGRIHITTTSPRETMFEDADTGLEGEVREVDGEPRLFTPEPEPAA